MSEAKKQAESGSGRTHCYVASLCRVTVDVVVVQKIGDENDPVLMLEDSLVTVLMPPDCEAKALVLSVGGIDWIDDAIEAR